MIATLEAFTLGLFVALKMLTRDRCLTINYIPIFLFVLRDASSFSFFSIIQAAFTSVAKPSKPIIEC